MIRQFFYFGRRLRIPQNLLNSICSTRYVWTLVTHIPLRIWPHLALNPGLSVSSFLVCRRLISHHSLVSSAINVNVGQSFIKCCNSISDPLLMFLANDIAAVWVYIPLKEIVWNSCRQLEEFPCRMPHNPLVRICSTCYVRKPICLWWSGSLSLEPGPLGW